jgi:hypothetical protein
LLRKLPELFGEWQDLFTLSERLLLSEREVPGDGEDSGVILRGFGVGLPEFDLFLGFGVGLPLSDPPGLCLGCGVGLPGTLRLAPRYGTAVTGGSTF